MKEVLRLLPLLLSLGAGKSDLDEWPFRKIGNSYTNIKPLLNWYHGGKFPKPRPLPEWEMQMVKVVQVVVRDIFNTTRLLFLKNYPGAAQVVDGDSITCYATRTGKHEYISTTGANNTVEQWDCGVCYDPAQKGPDGKAKLLQ